MLNCSLAVRRVFGLATVGFFMIGLCGCSGGVGNLVGKVSYKGKTVASGAVIAVGPDGVARYGKIEPDGSYRIDAIPVGEVKLAVNSPNPAPDPDKLRVSAPGAKRGGREQQDPITATPTSDPKLWFEIPAELGDVTRSGITTKIKRGDNPHNIEL